VTGECKEVGEMTRRGSKGHKKEKTSGEEASG
jgi:hypothetical protein